LVPIFSRALGKCLFTDGTTRSVFEAPDGRHDVEDDGEHVDGSWLRPADEPVVVPEPKQSRPPEAPCGRKRTVVPTAARPAP
jgi:hypothetical protein